MLSLSYVTMLLDMSRCHVMSSLPKAGSLEIRPEPNLYQICHNQPSFPLCPCRPGQTFPQTVNLPADMPSGPATIRWLWVAWKQMDCWKDQVVREPETNVVMKWMVVTNPSVTLESLGPCLLDPRFPVL